MSKHHHFGFRGGPDSRIQSGFRGPIPIFTLGSIDDRRDRRSSCSSSTPWELISDVPLEGVDREELEKLVFFGDSIPVLEEPLYEDECK